MTFASWLRSLTRGPAPTLKKSRPSTARTRDNRNRPSVELLEDRTLLSSYGLGFAIALGSTGTENAHSVSTDTSGNMFVAGNFDSASLDLDPGPGAYILPNAGGSDGFAAKYDPAGSFLWGVQVSGTGISSIYKVEVDAAGNALIAGIFRGSVEIGAPGRPPVMLSNGGSNEGFLAKFDPAGNALWARTFGTAADPRVAQGITTDVSGNVYATGSEGNRLFVAKYSADGATVWTQVVSGTGTLAAGTLVQGQSVAVDTTGNVFVVGPYGGKIDFNPDPLKTNFLTSIGLHPFGDDTFVLKLNAAGAYVWAGSMGGPGQDVPTGLAVDGTGNVIVSGIYGADSKNSKNDFDPGPGTLNLPGTGGTFVVKLDPNRNLIWGRSLAVSNVRDMVLDAAGNVYTTGMFSGTFDFDPGPGTFNLTSGGADAYVSKLNSSGSFDWAADILKGAPGSTGNPFGIAVDGSGNVYTSGYFKGTADFNPGAGTYSLTSTPDSIGAPTTDAFVSKLVPLSALQAAGGKAPNAAGGAILSAAQVIPLLTEALARWQAAGVDTSALHGIDIRIADLGGNMLGQASGHTITLDLNAAGWGWFVDRTPHSDSEFTRLGNQGEKHRIDLLTVLEHELGHLLGFEHQETGVMDDTLATGTRKSPTGHWSEQDSALVDLVFAGEQHPLRRRFF